MCKIYRQAVMAVIVNENNQVLFGYSPRDKSYKFPQGGIHVNEDVIRCIKRELKEELNYILRNKFIIKSYRKTVTYFFPPHVHPLYKGQELNIVKINYDKHAEINPQDDEFNHLIWINPNDITKYNSRYRLDAYIRALTICDLLSD